MTLKSRQRQHPVSAHRPAPPEQKWPETMEELNALPDSIPGKQPPKKPAPAYNPANSRARIEDNKHPSPRAIPPIHQLPLSPDTKPILSHLPLKITPSYSPPKPTPFQFTGQRNAFTPFKDPDPAPGPPPQPDSVSNTSGSPLHGMIDPGIAAAMQAQAKRDKELQDWATTAAIASAIGLATPKYPNGQPAKPTGGLGANPSSISGWTEWDVPHSARTQWENEHDADYYPSEYDDMELAPGEVSYKNPYGIDIDNFLHWVYSQVDYHEKEENKNLNSKGDAGGDKNWTKYGDWYGINGDYTDEKGNKHEAPWCAMFAAWCANKAGISEEKIPSFSSTYDYIKWYKDPSRNRFMPKGTYQPKAGDMILYRWKENGVWKGHTGIVVAYSVETDKDGKEKEYVYTIEGNYQDKVYFRQVPLDQWNLAGFGVNGGSSDGIVPAHYYIDGKLT